ncbi:polysaccharide export outer membrane protein [Novosphingobium sp. SG751A]|uniref:polysaccharide biosynthesis/export family protein n=1 Tax=Novosphingobium sp. SG751A TaxID=2587000 RepID=UPI001557922C|nr:polysaccharide biosynthesis/export family protein [Novosphingobium sp. SG751A]NOW45596.1 polysaccharide export outer membrane protein [Novosphingobium sp. SG751A]
MKDPRNRLRFALLAALHGGALLSLTACAQDRLPPLEPASAAAIQSAPAYVIAPGDLVRIVVYNEPNMTGDYLVLPEGTIQLPLIGVVMAKGQTASQLSDEILGKLRKGILTEPRISVNLAQMRSVFVSGAVTKPGAYPYIPDMTVDMAVAVAGGYTDRGAHNRVVLRHSGEAERQFELNPGMPIKLAPGDIIKVPERAF